MDVLAALAAPDFRNSVSWFKVMCVYFLPCHCSRFTFHPDHLQLHGWHLLLKGYLLQRFTVGIGGRVEFEELEGARVAGGGSRD